MTTDVSVDRLLDQYGQTYAEQAGIRLADKPAPLYQLNVLAMLLSARITASVAVASARELFAAGLKTPTAMRDSEWHDRLSALDRGGYTRYGSRAATMLGTGAELCLDRWGGDLRRLHREAAGDVEAMRRMLTEFPGIGPTGADIFLREVQEVWPDVRPYLDSRVTDGAQKLHLPTATDRLAGLVSDPQMAHFAAALVRAGRDRHALETLST